MARRALITGVGGQDGSYLAELLLEQGYEVFGTVREPGLDAYPNLAAIRDRIHEVKADLMDGDSLVRSLETCRPHEVYHLASVSFVPASWDDPVRTAQLAAVGPTALLESIRASIRRSASTRRPRARSSASPRSPADGGDGPSPFTPYGVAKAYAHFITGSYRRRYGLHASSESCSTTSRRGVRSVRPAQGRARGRRDQPRARGKPSRSATSTPAATGATRRDYVRAMWLMLQQDEGDDYVVATGITHSVGDLVEAAFGHVGLDWRAHVQSTLRCSAARRSCTTSSAIRQRRGSGWAGSRPSASRSWCACWSMPTSSASARRPAAPTGVGAGGTGNTIARSDA